MPKNNNKCGIVRKPGMDVRNESLGWLLRRCRSYRGVDFAAELPHMNAATQAPPGYFSRLFLGHCDQMYQLIPRVFIK